MKPSRGVEIMLVTAFKLLLVCSIKVCCSKIFYDSIYHTTAYTNWNSKNYFHKWVPSRLFCCWISPENFWYNISCTTAIRRTDYVFFMVPIKPAVISRKLTSSWTSTARFLRVTAFWVHKLILQLIWALMQLSICLPPPYSWLNIQVYVL